MLSLTDTPLKHVGGSAGKIFRLSSHNDQITKTLFTVIKLISLPRKVHQRLHLGLRERENMTGIYLPRYKSQIMYLYLSNLTYGVLILCTLTWLRTLTDATLHVFSRHWCRLHAQADDVAISRYEFYYVMQLFLACGCFPWKYRAVLRSLILDRNCSGCFQLVIIS
jgi:hypothetical protein